MRKKALLAVVVSMLLGPAVLSRLWADVPQWHQDKMRVENKAPVRAYAFDLDVGRQIFNNISMQCWP